MPEVLALVGSTSLDEATIVGIISDVSGWIDREFAGECTGQTPEQLEAIERYLSAHLVTKGGTTGAAGILKSATRLNVAETYDTGSVNGQDVATRFANAAASFDPCGIIGERWLGRKRVRVSFVVGYAG